MVNFDLQVVYFPGATSIPRDTQPFCCGDEEPKVSHLADLGRQHQLSEVLVADFAVDFFWFFVLNVQQKKL